MHLTLTIEADHPSELTPFLARFAPPQPVNETVAIKEVEPSDPPIEEEEAPAKKSHKGRAAKQDTAATKSPPESSDGPTATNDASPSDEPVTFEDLRAAATPLMEAGRGKDIREMLIAKFDGALAFGALKPEQYPAALAELQDLAA